MKEKSLVIVESPTKARTIKKFLPSHFIVEASIGHIRDLPQSASEIPSSKKGLDWARIGIDVENDFAPLYVTPKGKGKIINALKKRLKEVNALYLATDEDREGESISWHLVQVLRPDRLKIPIRRMVFHEITRSAITSALKQTREIDMDLVRSQETRRILDRLYGYTISPLLWKKIAYGLSAGRVQSPGLRLIVEREKERMAFKKAEYWDLRAMLSPQIQTSDQNINNSEEIFESRLISFAGKSIALGKDFDPTTGKLKKPNLRILLKDEAEKILASLKNVEWTVCDVQEKESNHQPPVPFITSTLQQEGNRKLGLSARETMRTAQRLYEEGLITYMRTDSPTISAEGISAARSAVEGLYGKNYLSPKPRQFSSTSKGAQEAHEAIRPVGSEFTPPNETQLSGREAALYDIIWKRTLASQMAEAKKASTVLKIRAGDALFQSNGTKILFPGYLKIYKTEDKNVLPNLQEGDSCLLHTIEAVEHETRPPARYTEASFIQSLEKLGIGRPSTYSSIIGTLFDRSYITKVNGSLVPSFLAVSVVQFLERNFAYLIEYGFTSDMESSLDQIAAGTQSNLDYLKYFYSGKNGLKLQVEQREKNISPEESRTINLSQLDSNVELRVGRYGPFIVADGDDGKKVHTSISEDIAPSDLTSELIQTLIEVQSRSPSPLGSDPETSLPVYCLNGRYGFYVQLGEVSEDNPKPKRASIPRDMNPQNIELADALKFLSIPRVLGKHPETTEEITAGIGRFGPFVVHQKDFRSLKKEDDVYSITLERALELLAEERKSSRHMSRELKELGEIQSKKVRLLSGKYGPYIKFGSKNIALPEEFKKAPETITLKDIESIIKS